VQTNATSTPARKPAEVASTHRDSSPTLWGHGLSRRKEKRGLSIHTINEKSTENFKTADAYLEFFMTGEASPRKRPMRREPNMATPTSMSVQATASGSVVSLRRTKKRSTQCAASNVSCGGFVEKTASPSHDADAPTLPCSMDDVTSRVAKPTSGGKTNFGSAELDPVSADACAKPVAPKKPVVTLEFARGSATNRDTSISDEVLSQLIMDDSWELCCINGERNGHVQENLPGRDHTSKNTSSSEGKPYASPSTAPNGIFASAGTSSPAKSRSPSVRTPTSDVTKAMKLTNIADRAPSLCKLRQNSNAATSVAPGRGNNSMHRSKSCIDACGATKACGRVSLRKSKSDAGDASAMVQRKVPDSLFSDDDDLLLQAVAATESQKDKGKRFFWTYHALQVLPNRSKIVYR